jgi:hypothetical protein
MLYNAQKHLLFAITLLFGLTVQAEDIIAKTIYSEASPICSFKERYLIASVISNRINHKGFYSLKTAEQVVSHPNAFEAYTSKNSNWTGYDKLNNKAKQEAKRLSLAIQSNKFHPIENIKVSKSLQRSIARSIGLLTKYAPLNTSTSSLSLPNNFHTTFHTVKRKSVFTNFHTTNLFSIDY